MSAICQEIKAFRNILIENWKFHYHKNLILLEDVDIDNILKCGMVFSSEKR